MCREDANTDTRSIDIVETRRGPKDGAERGTEEGEEGLEERTGRILSTPH